jgi:hypothetical protein
MTEIEEGIISNVFGKIVKINDEFVSPLLEL